MNSEIVTVYFWNPDTQKEVMITTDLDSIIKNPSGYRMDHVGVLLLNRERRKLGLTEYKFNFVTGTFDEVT